MRDDIERGIHCFITFVRMFHYSIVDTNPTILEQKVDFCVVLY